MHQQLLQSQQRHQHHNHSPPGLRELNREPLVIRMLLNGELLNGELTGELLELGHRLLVARDDAVGDLKNAMA